MPADSPEVTSFMTYRIFYGEQRALHLRKGLEVPITYQRLGYVLPLGATQRCNSPVPQQDCNCSELTMIGSAGLGTRGLVKTKETGRFIPEYSRFVNTLMVLVSTGLVGFFRSFYLTLYLYYTTFSLFVNNQINSHGVCQLVKCCLAPNRCWVLAIFVSNCKLLASFHESTALLPAAKVDAEETPQLDNSTTDTIKLAACSVLGLNRRRQDRVKILGLCCYSMFIP